MTSRRIRDLLLPDDPPVQLIRDLLVLRMNPLEMSKHGRDLHLGREALGQRPVLLPGEEPLDVGLDHVPRDFIRGRGFASHTRLRLEVALGGEEGVPDDGVVLPVVAEGRQVEDHADLDFLPVLVAEEVLDGFLLAMSRREEHEPAPPPLDADPLAGVEDEVPAFLLRGQGPEGLVDKFPLLFADPLRAALPAVVAGFLEHVVHAVLLQLGSFLPVRGGFPPLRPRVVVQELDRVLYEGSVCICRKSIVISDSCLKRLERLDDYHGEFVRKFFIVSHT